MTKEKDKRENLSPEEKTKRIVTWVSVFLLVVVIIVLILLLTLCDAKGDDITDGGNSGNGNNPVVECEHNIEILPAVAPTCEEKGLTEGKKCSKCDEIIVAQTEVPAIGHAYGQWESVDGLSHSRVCANDSTHVETEEHNWLTYDCTCHSCGFTDHSYDDVWIDNGDNHIKSCVSCPYANIVEDHDFQLISTTLATCEDPEIFTYQCVCGKSYTEEGAPATGHSWGEWNMVDENEHIRYCENGCYTAERSAHVVTDESRQYEPSCEYAGILIEWCALCGAVVRDEMLLPTGHDWSEWTDNGDGTCTRVCLNDGTHTETEPHVDDNADCLCDHCGSVEHDYPDTWTDNGTNHIKVCVNGCGVNLTEAHTHAETGRTPADCENAEIITYTCLCGNTYTEEGDPALGHDYPDTWTDNGDNHIKVCANGCGVDLVEEHSIQNYWLDPETKIVYYAQYCDICGTHVAERGDAIRTEDYLPVKTEYELRAILESVGGAELHAQVLNDITVDTPIYIDDIRHVTLSNGSTLTGTGTDEEGRYALFVANDEFYPYTSAEDDTVGGTFSVEGPAGEDAYIVVTNVCVETNIGNEVEGGAYKTTGDALFFMIDGASLLNHGPAMYITGSDNPTMVEGNIGGVRAHSGTFVNWDPTEYFEDKFIPYSFHTHMEVYEENGNTYYVVTSFERMYGEVIEPTCTEDGYTERICTDENCGDIYKYNIVSAVGHDWIDWTDNGDGTCTRVCLTDESHNETEPHIDENADCVCDHCGYIEHTETVMEAVSANCTETGLTEGLACSVCGEIFVAQEVIEINDEHLWDEWVLEDGAPSKRYCKHDSSHEEVVRFIKSNNIVIGSDIGMNYAVYSETVEGMSDIYIKYTKPIYNSAGEVIGEEATDVTEYTESGNLHTEKLSPMKWEFL